jgi:hypothetical protein
MTRFLAALALSLCVVSCNEDRPSSSSLRGDAPGGADDARGWQLYTSKEGGYSVLLPAPPSESSSVVEAAAGKTTLHLATVSLATMVYMLQYQDLPGNTPLDIKGTFDGARAAASESGGKPIEEKEIFLGEYPGREWLFDVPAIQGRVRARVYLVHRRMYELTTLAQGKDDMPGTATFFDSFKLVQTAPPASP